MTASIIIIINYYYSRMILSYNWQIMEAVDKDETELRKLATVPQPLVEDLYSSRQSPSNSMQPISLRSPIFGFLFCYLIEQPKTNPPEIDLLPQITMYEETVPFRLAKEVRFENYNSEIYDNLLVLTFKIRYHTESKLKKISSMDKLIRLVGNRQLNLYTATTYSTIRKEVIVESPVEIEYRHQKEGYLWMKLSRSEQNIEEVQIKEVQIMNWLSNGSEALKKEVVVNLVKGSFKLKGKESYALLFKLTSNIQNIQIPYYIIYRFPNSKQTFKMVKLIKFQ